jgi:choline dehydrogenase-like flavoprotein
MDYVIGSGLAGVACAKALLARGREVTMLDPGVTLEPDREASRMALAGRPPDQWSPAEKALRAPVVSGGIPDFKLVHGSNYPYRNFEGAPRIRVDIPGVTPSHALGGLSNVWGGAMLPYRSVDLEAWPVSSASMTRAYQAVLGYVPLAGRDDALAAEWPLHAKPAADMPISRQAARLLDRLENRQIPGITAGRARLAVRAPGCVACGECLNGCPRDLIYSARQELPALLLAGMHYRSGVSVHALDETAGGVRLIVRTGSDGQEVIHADRAYLAAGVYGSTDILMRSLGRVHAEILDSQYFLLPLLTATRTRHPEDEALHTLAQLFLEVEDRCVAPHNVHLQVYGYSSALDAAMANRLGPLHGLRRLFLERMLVVQGYLHSDYSGKLVAQMTDGRLAITATTNPETNKVLRRVVRRLAAAAGPLGALAIPPLLQQTTPGRGFHSGGSFPMREAPVMGETDSLGRPAGWRRVHVVDSSVFPDIPAATISLTVMANAWRIGHES